tara:strand:+ start:380 stop:1237 length:858 start_codon:yes stop_codon:yes gene_type:complete
MWLNLFNLSILLFILSFTTNLFAAKLDKFTFTSWNKPDLDVFYHLPKTIDNDTKVLFVVHGNTRNADDYLNSWIRLTKDKNIAIFAPHFKRSSFISFNTLQMSTSSGKIRTDTDLYLHNSIDTLFKYIKAKFKLNDKLYDIYGHSAGAQFVHRYLLMSDNPSVNKAVAANAGWYTFLNGADFPYGVKNPPISLTDSNVKKFLSTNLYILIGTNDIDVDSSINKSKGAQKQGINRLQRAKNFFTYTESIVEQNNLEFKWKYQAVPGAPHSNKVMSKAAVLVLFESD